MKTSLSDHAGVSASLETPPKPIRCRAPHIALCCLIGYLLVGCGDKPLPAPAPQNTSDVTDHDTLPEVCDGKDNNNVTAEVVALEQIITFNRFGAFNPAGMLYALRQDVVYDDPATAVEEQLPLPQAAKLDDPAFAKSIAGRVSLRSDKRPRPLVLRVNEGNCLQVKFWNLLAPLPETHTSFVRADFPRDKNFEPGKAQYAGGGVQRHSVQVTKPGDSNATDISTPPRDPTLPNSFEFPREEEPDYPTTRAASIHVNGLDYLPIRPEICNRLNRNATGSEPAQASLKAACQGAGKYMGSDGAHVGNNPNSLVEPGQHTTYVWFAKQEGGYFMYSNGALAGGEGDGGQLGLGLFGSINVEPKGSVWYRSQVTHDDLVAAAGGDSDYSHIDYRQLAIAKDGVIQHSDLNAVIYQTDKTSETPEVCSLRSPGSSCGMSFREFTTIFHDENKVFQAFAELSDESNPISRIADGMAVNYGASGVGSAVLANLKKIGPGKDCPECKLEEFFLSSWVNGDPAMIVRRDQEGRGVEALYADDPSNVHHSYLGDPVRFRNIHAGPKETHVFHLHAHQWLQDKNDPNANYLDSQTISPGSSYTYDIQYGGGGNRNLTVGDAIFHCHLYPHFAAGMWELWRNHDVFEDGKPGYFDAAKPISASNDPRMRNLPDNELQQNGSPNPAVVPIPGFALAPLPTADLRGYPFFIAGKPGHRPPQPPMDMAVNDNPAGAGDQWLDGGLPRHVITEGSNKAVDLQDPNQVKRLIESHGDNHENQAARYLANRVWKLNSDPNNLGLNKEVETATLRILPQCGTKDEILAMAFHAGWDKQTILGLKSDRQPANMPQAVWQACRDEFKQSLAELSEDSLHWTLTSEPAQWPVKRLIHRDGEDAKSPLTLMNPLWNGLGYQSSQETDPVDQKANPAFDSGKHFRVNGLPPAQGAPFADPCPAQYFAKPTDAGSAIEVNRSYPRVYKSAYIQFDMTVNKYGWHDPQARMPVLEQDAAKTLDGARLAEPLFFRANSGDCIQFQATNLIPSVLNLDDFQVYTPTDTIGQHIHLVKFDVTSSDGSANGWNYEDGTFSPDEVRERIDASHRGKVVDANDQPLAALTAKTHPMFKSGGSMASKAGLGTCAAGSEQHDHPWCGAQTTVQRWWADPVLNDKWDDRTMRAVFTHDHYGPSSHQQHGFYAALVVEPKDSVWAKLDASPDTIDSQQACNEQTLGGALKNGACRSDGGPTSYAANIGYPKDYRLEQLANNQQNVRREYNLAFADFAILYNADLRPVNPPSRQADLLLPHVVRDGLKPKPEGISAEDPGTRLLNYRNEPIPLRVAKEDADSLEYRQKAGNQGEMANVFSSVTHRDSAADPGSQPAWALTAEQHAAQRLQKLLANVPNEIDDPAELKAILKRGEERRRQFVKNLYLQEPWRDSKGGDPSTPVLAAYEGDPLQLHLIQGAQEEQHVFSMQGMKWLAEPHAPNSGYMNGQQLGISEHFEFDTLVSVPRASLSDYWLGSPAVENLWDGMWGMLRAHGPVGTTGSPAKIAGLARLPSAVVAIPPLVSGDPERLSCPSSHAVAKKKMYVTAWQVSQIKPLFYNDRPTFAIEDPNAIAFFEIPESVVVDAADANKAWNSGQKILDYLKQKYVTQNQPIEPLVLRANAGDCLDIQFKNYLPTVVENMNGKHVAAGSESYNLMPPIVNGFNFNQLQMSSRIGLVPQLVAENIPNSEGSNVGLNPRQMESDVGLAEGCQIPGDRPFEQCDKASSELVSMYRWYMGDQKVLSKSAKEAAPCKPTCIDQEIKDATKPDGEQITGYIRYTPMEFGAVSIRSFGDVIKHSSHGLVGALVVEPPNATYASSSNTVAEVTAPSGEKFKEFVLVVQDDLSLRQHHQPMPNHRMADDAEDTGQKGFNYRSEPLWARNGVGTSGADFNVLNALDYTNTLSSLASNPGCQGACGDPRTPVFTATAGESVRFRIVHPGGHSRQHAFILHGHNWDYQPWFDASTRLHDRDDSTPESEKPKTMRLGAIGGIGPGRHVNILTRAGGEFATPGDYLFRVQEQFQFQGGMWGIFRVNPK